MKKLLFTLMASLILSTNALAKEIDLDFKSFDGFELETKLETQDNKENPKNIIILIHGSGPANMDSDLTMVSNGIKNLFFKDLSSELSQNGFGVIRYNKRSYQSIQKIKENPEFAKSEIFQKYSNDFLNYFIKDADSLVNFVQKKYPNSNIYLYGISQGAYIAPQVANTNKNIKGIALTAFTLSYSNVILLEQYVYRSVEIFNEFDKNRDNQLDSSELEGEEQILQALKSQLPILDLDKDNNISLEEFKAGNFSNMIIQYPLPDSYLKTELERPKTSDILKESKFKTIILQGLWDNQTPAYNAKALELVNKNFWKKSNLKFKYYEKAGHILDIRDSYQDIIYKPIGKTNLKDISKEIKNFFLN